MYFLKILMNLIFSHKIIWLVFYVRYTYVTVILYRHNTIYIHTMITVCIFTGVHYKFDAYES